MVFKLSLSCAVSKHAVSLAVQNIQHIKMNFLPFLFRYLQVTFPLTGRTETFFFSPAMFHLSHYTFREAGADVSDTENERQNKEK